MRNTERGDVGPAILLLLIVGAVLAGGYYYMRKSRVDSEREARVFAHEVVDRLAVQKDLKFLHSNVNPDNRVDFSPGREQDFISMFKMLGTPSPDYQTTGNVVFENQYFSPHAKFKTILTYPDRHATVMLNVSCPHGPWKIDWLGVTYERALGY